MAGTAGACSAGGLPALVLLLALNCLTGWLLDALSALRHSNGAPVVRIYGPAGTDRRGATIAMNFIDPSGILIDSARVERRANMAGISLRSGCHCNPGVRETALGYSTQEMAAAFKDKDRLSQRRGVPSATRQQVDLYLDDLRFRWGDCHLAEPAEKAQDRGVRRKA